MADELQQATEETYQSPEMADILARIAEQDAIIAAAREELKGLRNARRRQARADAREAARLARERERSEALDLLRTLRETTLRKGDGTPVNALEYVTKLVAAQGAADGTRREADGSDSAHGTDETPASMSAGDGADSEPSDSR